MKHISLFSGIGGFDLAAEWMGWENIAHCEWNETCRRVLHYYWPKADTHEDITRSDFTIYRGFDGIITGGFPCQPFSLAGTRKGTADGRYLWPEMLRAIRESQPIAVVAENVAGLLTMGEYEMFARVDSRSLVRYQDSDHYEAVYTRQESMLLNNICSDLEEAGYQVQPVIIPASAVNAPHRRDRLWIIGVRDVADTISTGGWKTPQRGLDISRKLFQEGKWGKSPVKPERISKRKTTADTASHGQHEQSTKENISHREDIIKPGKGRKRTAKGSGHEWDAADTTGSGWGRKIDRTGKSGQSGKKSQRNDWENFPTESPICGGNDGLPTELDGITFSKWRQESIKAYGNAIVPQVAYQNMQAIEAVLTNNVP